MNTWLKRTATKRAVAACLAAAVLCTTVIVPHVWQAEVQGGEKERLFGSHYATNLGDTTDPSWTEEVEQLGIDQGYYPTGLNYASLSYTDINLFAFWSVPYAETLAQDGFDYAAFKNIVMYCVDKHTGQGAIDQAFTKGVLRMDENGDLVNPRTGEVINATQHATNKKFSMLMLLALMGYKADWSDVIGADGMFSKEDEAEYRLTLTRMLRGLIWIITDEEGFSGDWEADKATFLKHYPGADTLRPPSNDPIAAAMGVTTYEDFELFYSAWMAAKLNTNMSFDEDGKATKNPVSSVTNADGSVTKSYDFSKELVQAGIQNLLDVQVQGGTYSWDPATGMLNVTAPAGVEVTGNVLAKGDSWDGQVNGSVPNFGTALISRFYWGVVQPDDSQTPVRFDQSQNFMSITFTDAYEFSFGEKTPPKSEMHRYDHEEEWNADYNVRLYKFDSETGQPLQDSHFDILEKFDDTQLEKTNLEVSSKDAQGGVSAEELKEVTWDQDTGDSDARVALHYSDQYDLGVVETDDTLVNWGNDPAPNNTQFERWDDPYNDPCPRDDEITTADGSLGTNGTGDTEAAHDDSQSYDYHKGFCSGHPAPTIEYVVCTHEDGEECDCDEVNQQLHDEAWGKWYDEVQKCIELVNAGGFFHSIKEGEAQKAMEEDRDQFYKDFTSLTYEYSAVETQARPGYILHGLHTDDIPIEWRTVTSSQYKDWSSRGSLNHIGGSSEDGEGGDGGSGDEEESSISMSPANRIANTYSSDVIYDPLIIGSPSDAVGHAYENALAEYLAGHNTKAADDDPESEDTEIDLPDIVLADEDASSDDRGTSDTIEEAATVADKETEAEDPGTVESADKAEILADSETDDDGTEIADTADTVDGKAEEAIKATPSDALDKEEKAEANDEALNHLVEGTHSHFSFRNLINGAGSLFKRAADSLTNLMGLNGDEDEDEDDGEGGSDHSTGALHEELVTEESIANIIDPDDWSIIDWTFVVYDHRTEGEIHVNKQDLNLSPTEEEAEENPFDAYAVENGDGSLEGAVYGLFAASDIVHPDGNTKTVYEAGDLVAIATTDRNGDLSFMTYTEAPGTRYNYETGQTETTEWNGNAPKNLHRKQSEAAQEVQDIEVFVGHDPDKTEITAGNDNDLPDTADSGDGTTTWYKKYSTNQEYDSGKLASNDITNEKRDTYRTDDTTGYYPISDNEANNGNCWIGRPLIVSGQNSVSYYVKELSRSEGYELSVEGKDLDLTNRLAGFGEGERAVTLYSSNITKGGWAAEGVQNYNEFTVHSEGTKNYRVELSNVSSKPHVYRVKEEQVWDDNAVSGAEVATRSVPQKAVPGNYVYIEGKKVEAEVGDEIELPNGERATVQAVSPTDPLTLTVMPGNRVTTQMPKITSDNQNGAIQTEADLKKLVMEYNNKLTEENVNLSKAYAKAAPYFLVDISSATNVQTVFDLINSALESQTLFNRFYVQEIKEINGKKYAVVRYTYMEGASTIPVAIYDPDTETIYLHASIIFNKSWPDANGDYQDVPGYVFVPYTKDEYTVVTSASDGFVTKATLSQKKPALNYTSVEYPSSLEGLNFVPALQESYWIYAEGEQMRDDEGNLMYRTEETWTPTHGAYVTKTTYEEITPVTDLGNGRYSFDAEVEDDGEHDTKFWVTYEDGYVNYQLPNEYFMRNGIISLYTDNTDEESYIVWEMLAYPGDTTISSDAGTVDSPAQVYERPVRQKIRIEKDIQTLPETRKVWYCLNCGSEIENGVGACAFCGKTRSTEETRVLNYANDTYAAFHSENISAERDAGDYSTTEDWLSALNGSRSADETPESIGNFRFKAYLKSNLERLYRDEDGNVTWMDRNGNTMTPQYEDTNGDGNYDTFTWKYDTAYEGKTVDFPEKDKVTQTEDQEDVLTMTNVQKIYTEVEHPTGQEQSTVTSDRANNVWDTYADPQDGARANAGEIEGYTTSLKGDQGDSVTTNAALYSYKGQASDRNRTDYLQDQQNTGYTRLLETRRQEIEDGTSTTSVETYNYEKFFDAIQAANTDIWDDDMFSTYDGEGLSMENYPGQNWFETFYEKYQKDDADPDHSTADANQDQVPDSVDKADADNTAGGDRDTSFKPFRWIRENVFGDRTDYEEYPAERNGNDTENAANTSDYARANAEASDAVRQFAVKWYLDDEAAKLMVDNGLGENVANQEKLGTNTEGEIGYDEAVYDLALFNAIAKAYNYLKPFYLNDLDTIYSVEWDSAPNGGADSDFTTLSADINADGTYSNVSSYLPYGVYVIVEQQPERRDENVNDWESRSYDIEKPKEVIVPSVYEGTASNDTTDNYSTHYTFNAEQLLTDQAKQDNYLIRFGEENSDNTTNQDQREFVIRAHGYYGDFEVYKYGLDVDQLHGTITAPNSTYYYGGWDITQEEFDPLKDYYQPDHRGEAVAETDDGQDDGDDGGDGGNGNGDTSAAIGKENGGNESSVYHGNEPNYTANGNGVETANGSTYDGDSLRKRFFYASISEDDGVANNVLFKDGAVDQNNMSGMSWHDNVQSTTGELTAYDGKYAAALVPWTVTEPADYSTYDAATFSGYADVNERNRFYTAYLRINKTDSETGEYILHDDAIFGLYAASRYNSFEEIEEDAKLITDAGERARFLMQFKPGDAKFYLQDTMITGSKEFLEAMKARDITPYAKGKDRTLNESMAGSGERYTGIVSKGTPVCIESERVDLYDGNGSRTGQMTVWTTRGDLPMDDPETKTKLEDGGQNVGYFKTSQPIGAGVYVLAEIKPPSGYARSNPVAIEVYSDGTTYYVDGDMYAKVDAVRYESKTTDGYPYKNADEANARQ